MMSFYEKYYDINAAACQEKAECFDVKKRRGGVRQGKMPKKRKTGAKNLAKKDNDAAENKKRGCYDKVPKYRGAVWRTHSALCVVFPEKGKQQGALSGKTMYTGRGEPRSI